MDGEQWKATREECGACIFGPPFVLSVGYTDTVTSAVFAPVNRSTFLRLASGPFDTFDVEPAGSGLDAD